MSVRMYHSPSASGMLASSVRSAMTGTSRTPLECVQKDLTAGCEREEETPPLLRTDIMATPSSAATAAGSTYNRGVRLIFSCTIGSTAMTETVSSSAGGRIGSKEDPMLMTRRRVLAGNLSIVNFGGSASATPASRSRRAAAAEADDIARCGGAGGRARAAAAQRRGSALIRLGSGSPSFRFDARVRSAEAAMADGAACVAHKACVRSFCTPPFVARRELEPAWLYSRATPAVPQGIGALLNWRKAAFIYADAGRVPWFGRLVNSHDGADYAQFFEFGDPLCVDAPSTAANSSAALVHTEPDRHFVTRMAGHGGALARICRAVEAGGGGDASAINGSSIIRDLRSGGGLILPVDQFRSGLSYCAYSARFRERFRRARARRKRVVKAADERWVCVHFRWGDVHTQSHLWYNKDRIHRG